MASLKKLIASTKAARVVRNTDRRDDFDSASDSLSAIFGNLRTTQRGVSRTMTKANARTLANMERVLGRAQAGRGRAGAAGAKAEDLYGTALGSSIRQQLGTARATGRSTAIQAGGLEKQGAMTHRAGVEAMDLLQEGTAMAKQSAKAGLAQALAIRATDDAALTAEAQLELAKAKLDARQSGEGAGGQSPAVQAMAEGAAAGWTKQTALANLSSFTNLYNMGPKAVADLRRYITSTWTGGLDEQAGTYAPVDSEGAPIQTTINNDDKVDANEAVWRIMSDEDPDATPSKANVRKRISDQFIANHGDADGKLTSSYQRLLDQLLDYVDATYDRIVAAQKKVLAAAGGTDAAAPAPTGTSRSGDRTASNSGGFLPPVNPINPSTNGATRGTH